MTTQTAFTVLPVPGPGAEDVVVATHGPHEGSVFTGTEDGAIVRVAHDGERDDPPRRLGHAVADELPRIKLGEVLEVGHPRPGAQPAAAHAAAVAPVPAAGCARARR